MEKNYYFIKINQNIDFDMYVWKMNILDLFDIHEVKPITEDSDSLSDEILAKDFLNNVLVAQRNEKTSRIKEIANYVSEWVIPNSIILGNLEWEKGIEFKSIENWLFKLIINDNLSDSEKLFVIDWQHRLKWAALYTYSKILSWLLSNKKNNDINLIKDLNIINSKNNYLEKISWIKNIIINYNLDKFYNDILSNINILEFSVVILNKITNKKIVEIFTDINSHQKPLDSNIYRYYYWRFTTKFPYLNVSVNIAKLLNENEKSSLHWLIKMPYKVKYYENNLKWLSKVWVWAFCERFNWISEIKDIDLNLKNINFFKKPLWIFINHNLLNWNDKIIISDKSIISSIRFLFIFFTYSYNEINNLYYSNQEIIKLDKDSKEYRNYKFIDSTTNELYFNVIKHLIILTIIDYNYNIDNIFNLSKDNIKKSVSENFLKIKEALIFIYKENKYFKKWEIVWTWWAKSSKIIKEFENKIDDISSVTSNEFNNNIIKYYNNIK